MSGDVNGEAVEPKKGNKLDLSERQPEARDDSRITTAALTNDDRGDALKAVRADAGAEVDVPKVALTGSVEVADREVEKPAETDKQRTEREALEKLKRKGVPVDGGVITFSGPLDSYEKGKGERTDEPGKPKPGDDRTKVTDGVVVGESDPKTVEKMKLIKAGLEGLLSGQPQKGLEGQKILQEAKNGDGKYGEQKFTVEVGGKKYDFNSQVAEIKGNRGKTNVKYANMTHLFVSENGGKTKVVLRGNELTKPPKDGDKYDKQRHYKSGEIVDFPGTKGGHIPREIREAIKKDGEAKIQIDQDGVKMEATAKFDKDGELKVEIKEIKPKPSPKELAENREQARKAFLEKVQKNPDVFLPRLTAGDNASPQERAAIINALSDGMNIKSITVEDSKGVKHRLSPVALKAGDSPPNTFHMKYNGDDAYTITTDGKNWNYTPGSSEANLNKIDWNKAKVKIEFESGKGKPVEFEMPEKTRYFTKLSGEDMSALLTKEISGKPTEKLDKVHENKDSMVKQMQASLGYRFPEVKNNRELFVKLAKDPSNGFSMFNPENASQLDQIKPGDLVFMMKKGTEKDTSAPMTAGIVDKDGNVIVPSGDKYLNAGSVKDVFTGSEYSATAFRPEGGIEVKTTQPPKAEHKIVKLNVGSGLSETAEHFLNSDKQPYQALFSNAKDIKLDKLGDGGSALTISGMLKYNVSERLKPLGSDALLKDLPEVARTPGDLDGVLAKNRYFTAEDAPELPAKLPEGSVIIARTAKEGGEKWADGNEYAPDSRTYLAGKDGKLYHVDPEDNKWKVANKDAIPKGDGVSYRVYKPVELQVQQEAKPEPAAQQAAADKVNDVATLLKSGNQGQLFEKLGTDAKPVDVENALKAQVESKAYIKPDVADPSKFEYKPGDVVAATAADGTRRLAMFVENKEGQRFFALEGGERGTETYPVAKDFEALKKAGFASDVSVYRPNPKADKVADVATLLKTEGYGDPSLPAHFESLDPDAKPEEVVKALKAHVDAKVYTSQVLKSEDAAKFEFKPGDVVTAADGTKVAMVVNDGKNNLFAVGGEKLGEGFSGTSKLNVLRDQFKFTGDLTVYRPTDKAKEAPIPESYGNFDKMTVAEVQQTLKAAYDAFMKSATQNISKGSLPELSREAVTAGLEQVRADKKGKEFSNGKELSDYFNNPENGFRKVEAEQARTGDFAIIQREDGEYVAGIAISEGKEGDLKIKLGKEELTLAEMKEKYGDFRPPIEFFRPEPPKEVKEVAEVDPVAFNEARGRINSGLEKMSSADFLEKNPQLVKDIFGPDLPAIANDEANMEITSIVQSLATVSGIPKSNLGDYFNEKTFKPGELKPEDLKQGDLIFASGNFDAVVGPNGEIYRAVVSDGPEGKRTPVWKAMPKEEFEALIAKRGVSHYRIKDAMEVPKDKPAVEKTGHEKLNASLRTIGGPSGEISWDQLNAEVKSKFKLGKSADSEEREARLSQLIIDKRLMASVNDSGVSLNQLRHHYIASETKLEASATEFPQGTFKNGDIVRGLSLPFNGVVHDGKVYSANIEPLPGGNGEVIKWSPVDNAELLKIAKNGGIEINRLNDAGEAARLAELADAQRKLPHEVLNSNLKLLGQPGEINWDEINVLGANIHGDREYFKQMSNIGKLPFLQQAIVRRGINRAGEAAGVKPISIKHQYANVMSIRQLGDSTAGIFEEGDIITSKLNRVGIPDFTGVVHNGKVWSVRNVSPKAGEDPALTWSVVPDAELRKIAADQGLNLQRLRTPEEAAEAEAAAAKHTEVRQERLKPSATESGAKWSEVAASIPNQTTADYKGLVDKIALTQSEQKAINDQASAAVSAHILGTYLQKLDPAKFNGMDSIDNAGRLDNLRSRLASNQNFKGESIRGKDVTLNAGDIIYGKDSDGAEFFGIATKGGKEFMIPRVSPDGKVTWKTRQVVDNYKNLYRYREGDAGAQDSAEVKQMQTFATNAAADFIPLLKNNDAIPTNIVRRLQSSNIGSIQIFKGDDLAIEMTLKNGANGLELWAKGDGDQEILIRDAQTGASDELTKGKLPYEFEKLDGTKFKVFFNNGQQIVIPLGELEKSLKS